MEWYVLESRPEALTRCERAGVAVIGGLVRVDRPRPGEPVEGLVVVTPLVGQDAESVEGAGKVGGGLEDSAVERLGLGELAPRTLKVALVEITGVQPV